jgi:hypothetical protein
MIPILAAVLLGSAAAAAPAPTPKPAPAAPAVHASTSAAPGVRASTSAAGGAAAADLALGVSTYTVSTLYTGDRVRDPFLPLSMGGGGPGRAAEKSAALGVDIQGLQLRGIMKDEKSDFALFSMDNGKTLVLRDGHLYDERNKRVPGITGRIYLKKKMAKLVTADKDEKIYSFGESGDDKDKDQEQPQSDDSQ